MPLCSSKLIHLLGGDGVLCCALTSFKAPAAGVLTVGVILRSGFTIPSVRFGSIFWDACAVVAAFSVVVLRLGVTKLRSFSEAVRGCSWVALCALSAEETAAQIVQCVKVALFSSLSEHHYRSHSVLGDSVARVVAAAKVEKRGCVTVVSCLLEPVYRLGRIVLHTCSVEMHTAQPELCIGVAKLCKLHYSLRSIIVCVYSVAARVVLCPCIVWREAASACEIAAYQRLLGVVVALLGCLLVAVSRLCDVALCALSQIVAVRQLFL